MSTSAYLFEKACFVLDAVASMGEDLRRLPPGSRAERDVSAHLQVAARQGLVLLCEIAGCPFEPTWVQKLVRVGYRNWLDSIKPLLETALFGPEDQAARRIKGMPREHTGEDRPVDEEVAVPKALKTVAALLDLGDAVRKHGAHEADSVSFEQQLAWGFNGATKVVTTLVEREWDVHWPEMLAQRGRAALDPFLVALRTSGDSWAFEHHLQPLDEAWLADADPEKTPAKEQAAERKRRAGVTSKKHLSGDLVIPKRYRGADIARLAESPVREHRECVAYAKEPSGSLVLLGNFKSALHGIQWAIGNHWFVQQLQAVRALYWHSLVEDNLTAQARSNWSVPRLLLCEILPVFVEENKADPGYAAKLIDYRLTEGLPTVLAVESCGLDALNLPADTLQRLESARRISLPTLSPGQLEAVELVL